MNLYEKIKGMTVDEMACLMGRMTIDSVYNAAISMGIPASSISDSQVKDIIDTWKESLLTEVRDEA